MTRSKCLPAELALLEPLHASLRALETALDASAARRFDDFAAWRHELDLRNRIAELRDQMIRFRRCVTRPTPCTRRRPHPRSGNYDLPF